MKGGISHNISNAKYFTCKSKYLTISHNTLKQDYKRKKF